METLNEIQATYNRKYVGEKVTDSQKAVDYIKPTYQTKMDLQEVFSIILLSRSNQILGHYTVSTGGIAGTVVDAKLIFAIGLKCLASGIILCHNHPSGALRPSIEDIKITKKLIEGGKLLDITILDHIILTSEGHYSLKDHGDIE